ncbi:VOC family protein, partial [Puniceibacterium confluentis]|uniref:VOC family protein n=1 Tax=Puniceibacterium confluentis TaxID=1958944 RepID=UPI0035666AF3
SDIVAALDSLPMAGRPVRLGRGALEWTMAVPEDGCLPFDGMFPALIEWHSPVPPGTLMDTGGPMLDQLLVRHPEAAALAALLGPHLTDGRVAFTPAATPGLQATFSTRSGQRTLQ